MRHLALILNWIYLSRLATVVVVTGKKREAVFRLLTQRRAVLGDKDDVETMKLSM